MEGTASSGARGRGTRRRSRPGISSDCFHLLNNRHNFHRSGLPARLLFYSYKEWHDFTGELLHTLIRAFAARREAVDIEFNTCHFLVDFLRMLQIDLFNGVHRSIAWIDTTGRCFFPHVLTSCDSLPPHPPAIIAPPVVAPVSTDQRPVALPLARPRVEGREKGKEVVVQGGRESGGPWMEEGVGECEPSAAQTREFLPTAPQGSMAFRGPPR